MALAISLAVIPLLLSSMISAIVPGRVRFILPAHWGHPLDCPDVRLLVHTSFSLPQSQRQSHL
jgi:hypothetical protein